MSAVTSQEQRDSSGRERGNGNLKPFVKGQSGNPGGRPKGPSLTRLLREALAKTEIRKKDGSSMRLPEGQTVLDLVATIVLQQALGGDVRIIKEIWDRLDGRVPAKVDAAVHHSSPTDLVVLLKEETIDDVAARKAVARALQRLADASDATGYEYEHGAE